MIVMIIKYRESTTLNYNARTDWQLKVEEVL